MWRWCTGSISCDDTNHSVCSSACDTHEHPLTYLRPSKLYVLGHDALLHILVWALSLLLPHKVADLSKFLMVQRAPVMHRYPFYIFLCSDVANWSAQSRSQSRVKLL